MMDAASHLRLSAAIAATLVLGGCEGVQSALAPEGPEASRIALLSWVLTIGSGVILIGVIVIAAIAMFGSEANRRRLGGESVVVGGGIVFPVITLTALLVYGLLVMRAGSSTSNVIEGEPVRITVVGEQWWWRVSYEGPAGSGIESANEIRIPIRRPIEISLASADVIHSFWVPKLAGKLDMIPGRKNMLRLAADKPGVSRGQCAEYCGGAHALMSFYVVAMLEPEFQRWLTEQTAPAPAPRDPQAQQGEMLFLASGCGACHAIRGTAARGTIGPDLTHVGGRMSLAAASLPNNQAAFARWIRDNQHVKPGNLMPPFGIFSDNELAALSYYLASLR